MTAPFTADGIIRGARAAAPLGLGIFVYGLAFGLVAVQAQFALGQAMAMSAAVYSGSAQLAAINLIQTGQVTVVALAATILLMNARYLMFGAALQPWLHQAHPRLAYTSLLVLGDGNWLMVMRAIERGEQDRGYLLGSGLPMFAGWMLGTATGALSGQILPDPHTLAADLMLPAFAAAMMAGMMRSRAALLPAAVGAITAVVVLGLAGAGWAIIVAGLAGAATAALAWRPPAVAMP
ncbi:MAG: ABC transporter permease [Cereibacter sphaeroides]|uniref:ABC transporter permease n=1 Tax=Cereibacter sphaeroides TaxID=1063 RepID=A0A2W5S809_CERSP|nr:MAG: ABC transporter permease [Cereibacter sphaeroides]